MILFRAILDLLLSPRLVFDSFSFILYDSVGNFVQTKENLFTFEAYHKEIFVNEY